MKTTNTENSTTGSGLTAASCSILHLTLHKKWFDMISRGEKLEEYREIKPYWDLRLNKSYDAVKFVNGYGDQRPWMIIELQEHLTGLGIEKWGAPLGEHVHILKLGAILESNVKAHIPHTGAV